MDIQKLSRTLSELSKLDFNDLKNIDYRKLIRDLAKQKDTLIQLIIVILSLIASISIFSSNNKASRALVGSLSALEAQLTALKELNAVKDEQKKLRDTFPQPLEYERIIEKINEIAITNDVDVLNFSPANIRSAGLYNLSKVRIAVLASSFSNLWRFIYALDTSPYALMVDNLQVRPAAARRQEKEANLEGKFNLDIEITSLNITK